MTSKQTDRHQLDEQHNLSLSEDGFQQSMRAFRSNVCRILPPSRRGIESLLQLIGMVWLQYCMCFSGVYKFGATLANQNVDTARRFYYYSPTTNL